MVAGFKDDLDSEDELPAPVATVTTVMSASSDEEDDGDSPRPAGMRSSDDEGGNPAVMADQVCSFKFLKFLNHGCHTSS